VNSVSRSKRRENFLTFLISDKRHYFLFHTFLSLKKTCNEILEVSENETNRARLVALVVREAIFVANRQDWDAACRMILQHNLLTWQEKSAIVALLQIKPS